MVYSNTEKQALERDLNRIVRNLNNASLLNDITKEEITNTLYRELRKKRNSNIFYTKAIKERDTWQEIETIYNKSGGGLKAAGWYAKEKRTHADNIQTLQDELYLQVNEFVEKKIDPILKLEEGYKVISATTPTTTIDDAAEDISSSSPFVRSAIQTHHINELSNGWVSESVDALINLTVRGIPGGLSRVDFRTMTGGQNVREFLLNCSNDEIKTLENDLSMINRDGLKELVKSEITEKVTEKTQKINEINTKYAEAKEKIDIIDNAETTHLNDDIRGLAGTFAWAKLNKRTEELTNIRDRRPYKKIKSAVLKQKVHELQMDYNGVLYTLDDAYRQITHDVESETLSKEDGLKQLEEILGRIDDIDPRISSQVDTFLTRAGKSVLGMYSANDHERDGEFDFDMYDSSGNLVNNHDPGTHVGVTLDYLYRKFIRGPDLIDVKKLEKTIVAKHKHRSSLSYRLFHRMDDNKITVKEALEYAIGQGVSQGRPNLLDEIGMKMIDIELLGMHSDIEEILTAYDGAADLVEEINADIWHYTTRTDSGYDQIDNMINNAAGYVYKSVDRVRDFVDGLFKFSKNSGKMIPETETDSEKYNVNITAIKPKSHPNLQFAFASIFGPLALYYAGKTTVHVLTKEEKEEGAKAENIENLLLSLLGLGGGFILSKGTRHI